MARSGRGLVIRILLKITSIAVVFISGWSAAADVSDHIVGVRRSVIEFGFPPHGKTVEGNGTCIDPRCSVAATAYHIQKMVGRANLGIVGGRTVKVLSLANQSDATKIDVVVAGTKKRLYLNLENDLCFVYSKVAIKGKSGIPYSYKFHIGQKVEVVGYFHNKLWMRKTVIIGANVRVMIGGKLAVTEDLVLNGSLFPGASGGAVLDEAGNLLGMVILISTTRTDTLQMSVALPVTTIARTLVKLDPLLGSSIFKNIPQEKSVDPIVANTSLVLSQDSYVNEDVSSVIPLLSPVFSDVPFAVRQLQQQAEAASQFMNNLVSKQCIAQGNQKPICQEVAIADGEEVLRKIVKSQKAGKKFEHYPVRKGVWGENSWSGTIDEVGDEPWLFAGKVEGNYLFTFKSGAEDNRCYFEEYPQSVPLFGGRSEVWKGPVDCFQQILTDKDFNAVAIFQEMFPPDNCLTEVHEDAVYYDWVIIEGLDLPVLLPVRERIAARAKGQKELLYTEVSWTQYRMFRAEHIIKTVR
jgi:hypothetical protein